MSEYREWTLLLTGEHSGLVGEASYKFSGSPDYYERVDVVEKQRIAELEQENERLREAIRASQNGTICPLCNSMPHNDSCPALNGEVGDE